MRGEAMRKNKGNRSKFAKANTPELIKNQRAAIIAYYTKKRKERFDNDKK